MNVAEGFRADLMHSSQFCWGALPLNVPKLITAHSDVRSWAAACRCDELSPSPWLDRYDLLVQDGIHCADALVAPTAWMRDALRKHFEISPRFHVIPNGRTVPRIDLERERELRAVSVGRLWDEGKGLAIISEIVSPMPVLLAGEPSFEDAANLDLPSNVTTLGSLDETNLFDLFLTSSVYLATSLYEPFGLAPLEAALCGCAIVARDLPPFREVWGDAALYFKDAVSLQNVLAELARDSDKLHRTRGAALERAHFFTAKGMADRYASLYRELIEGASSDVSRVEEELHAA
jgi:glycosyltransferase involved in cell wall biosynthesis